MKKPSENDRTNEAAILLMSLNSDDAAKIIKHLEPKEVQKLGMAMAALEKIDTKTVQKVYVDFIQETSSQTSIGLNKDDQIRNVLVTALGEDKASGIINRILTHSNSKGLDNLKWMDAKNISELIMLEHPQIQAIILSYLEPDQAAEVLAQMDEQARLDVIMRISMQEGVQPNAFDELNRIMENQMVKKKHVQAKMMGGVQSAASILNFLERHMEADVLEGIKELDNSLADKIQDLMFIFDNLKTIDDKGMQTLLRELDTNTLVLALKGSDEELKEKIFKNMSKRAALLLKDDLEAKGPVRVSEVEAAQKSILTTAKSLADNGKIQMGSNAEEML